MADIGSDGKGKGNHPTSTSNVFGLGSPDMPISALNQRASKKFNVKPKDGIEFLLQQGLVDGSAEDVAKYLHE
jgi:hypothetical protein